MKPTVSGGTPPPPPYDNLHRKNKKQKNISPVPDISISEEHEMKEAETESSPSPKSPKSFKDALLKIYGDDDLDACWGDLLAEEIAEEKMEKPTNVQSEQIPKPNSVIPAVDLSKEELEAWSKPWRNTLIVKVLGKKVSFRMLEGKLRKSWLLHGDLRITDLAEDFYIVQLSDIEDYKHALFEGPWKIADRYLIVQRWRPLFSLSASLTKKVAVWVRVPKLPVELCNDKFLNRIGATIGTMLRIDKVTSIHSRGKFARICVEIDLDKPLISHFTIWGMKLCLEYEGLHAICFRCGKYGHKKENCREMLEVAQENVVINGDDDMVAEQLVQTEVTEAVPMQPENEKVEMTKIVVDNSEQEESVIGPWNIPKYVSRKNKKNNSPKSSGFPKPRADVVSNAERNMNVTTSTLNVGTGPVKNSSNGAVVEQMPNDDSPRTKPPPKPKIRNATGGRNPQTPALKKGQQIIRNQGIKEGSNLHIGKVNPPDSKQAPRNENIASSSKANELKAKTSGIKVNPEEEAILAYMKAMNESFGTKLLTKIQGMDDGRIALANIDDKNIVKTKKKVEDCIAAVPMDVTEGTDMQTPSNQKAL